MTTPYKPIEQGHWYDVSGQPHHFRENGKPTTLKDAREHGWFPSVTKVIRDTLPQTALLNWKINQAILAALTLPRKEGEALEAFADRVVEDMTAESEAAKDIGHELHDLTERLMAGLGSKDQQLGGWSKEAMAFVPSLRSFRDSAFSAVLWTERIIVAARDGYAGTADCLAYLHPLTSRSTLLDFKFRKKQATYNEDLIQLAAYHYGLGFAAEDVRIASVVVDKTNPERLPKLHHWGIEELQRGVRIWKLCWELWQELNSYRPLRRLQELAQARPRSLA